MYGWRRTLDVHRESHAFSEACVNGVLNEFADGHSPYSYERLYPQAARLAPSRPSKSQLRFAREHMISLSESLGGAAPPSASKSSAPTTQTRHPPAWLKGRPLFLTDLVPLALAELVPPKGLRRALRKPFRRKVRYPW